MILHGYIELNKAFGKCTDGDPCCLQAMCLMSYIHRMLSCCAVHSPETAWVCTLCTGIGNTVGRTKGSTPMSAAVSGVTMKTGSTFSLYTPLHIYNTYVSNI